MAALRYIVPALAVVAGAAAQCGTSGETTTIQNSGDASALSGCSTFKGSIEIASTTSGAISLDGITTIDGDLIANATGVTAISAINGSIGFYFSTFKNLTAANLTEVGGDLTFVGNNELTNISFPLLTSIGGGFNVANNSALDTVDGFPELETVGGAVNFDGAFTSIDLPKLNDVRGAFDVLSSKNLTETCATFDNLGDVVQGSESCMGESSESSTAGQDGSDTSSSGSGSSTKKGAATSVIIPGSTIVLGLVAALFGLL